MEVHFRGTIGKGFEADESVLIYVSNLTEPLAKKCSSMNGLINVLEAVS